MTEHEKFEAWAKSEWDGDLGSKDVDGDYYFEPIQLQWVSWQAATASTQEQVTALAAENAELKSNLMFWDAEDPEAPYDCPEDIAENCQMDFNTEFDVQVAARMPNRTYRVCEITEFERSIELVSGGETETPATDAFIAEQQAIGVEKFSSDVGLEYQQLNPGSAQAKALKSIVFRAVSFAKKLRDEVKP